MVEMWRYPLVLRRFPLVSRFNVPASNPNRGDLDRCRIELQFLKIEFAELPDEGLPDPVLAPAVKPPPDGVPVAKTLRQIAPGHSRFGHVQNGVHEQPIVLPGPAGIARLSRKQIPDAIPLFIRESMSRRHCGVLHDQFQAARSLQFQEISERGMSTRPSVATARPSPRPGIPASSPAGPLAWSPPFRSQRHQRNRPR